MHGLLMLHDAANEAPGPARARLRYHPRIKGLVIGADGAAPKDIHTLLRSTAAHLAMRDWHKMGARNESEALGYSLNPLRRRFVRRLGSSSPAAALWCHGDPGDQGGPRMLPTVRLPVVVRLCCLLLFWLCCSVRIARLSLILMPAFLPLFLSVFFGLLVIYSLRLARSLALAPRPSQHGPSENPGHPSPRSKSRARPAGLTSSS